MDLATWQPFIDWLHHHPHWIGWITCLVALSESLVIVGLIVPGAIMMVAIGTLIGADVIPFTSTVLYGVLGAILGDGISYWVGHHYHDRLRDLWPFNKYPQWLEKGESFFTAHGTKSVFMGRFVGPVRPLVPVIAGMLNMSPIRFYTANFISAFIWSPCYMLPGILLGTASKEFGPEVATHFLLAVLGILIAIALSAWIIKFIWQRCWQALNTLLVRTWQHMQYSQRYQLIQHWCRNPQAPNEHQLLGLLIFMSVLFVCFIVMAVIVLNHSPLLSTVNHSLFYLLRSLRNHTWDQVMVGITLLGNSKTLIPMWVFVTLGLAAKKQMRFVLHWILIGIGVSAVIILLKHGFYSSRPADIIHVRTTSSFPSAHTTLATVFYGVLATWVGLQCQSAYVRHTISACTLTLISLIAFSRLYLGAHWLTDIIGAFLLGSSFIVLAAFLSIRHHKPRLSLIHLSLSLLLGFTIIMPIQVHFKFQQYLYNHTPYWPSHTMSTDTWWQSDGRPLAIYLYSRTRKPLAPFNIQWLGDIKQIEKHLIERGWRIPPKMKIGHSLKHLNHNGDVTYQPFFTKLFQNQRPSLILIKYYEHQRIPLMLQLWRANMQFTDNVLPLWIGTLHSTPPQQFFKKTYPVANVLDQKLSRLITQFTSDLTPLDWKKCSRTLPSKVIQQLHLQHDTTHILLIRASQD